jgi:hypothetical protein
MFWTRLAKGIASFLTVGRMDTKEQRELVCELTQRLCLPTLLETGTDWCIDYVTCDTIECVGDRIEAAGSFYWLAGGGEFDRYSFEVAMVDEDLEYCFVFYKLTKNRNRVRLMAGCRTGEQYSEFFAREGSADWWSEEVRVQVLA